MSDVISSDGALATFPSNCHSASDSLTLTSRKQKFGFRKISTNKQSRLIHCPGNVTLASFPSNLMATVIFFALETFPRFWMHCFLVIKFAEIASLLLNSVVAAAFETRSLSVIDTGSRGSGESGSRTISPSNERLLSRHYSWCYAVNSDVVKVIIF